MFRFTSYPPRVHMQRTRFPVFVNMYIVISVENIARDGLRITRGKEFVGKTCVFDLEEPMMIVGYIIRVRGNKGVLPTYLSAVLNSQYGKQTLADMCKAIVGQANMNAQELQDTVILIPSIELQERFSSSAETVKKSKLTIQQSLDKLEVLKKALMQHYFERGDA